MIGLMHLFALSIYSAAGLSLVLGVAVFVRNAIFRGDRKYETRFPWWLRLSLYLVVLLILPVGSSRDLSNTPWWAYLLLIIVAYAIPLLGVLSGLWLCGFRKTRERVKLGNGLLFVSLIPIAYVIGISVDPNTKVISRHSYSDHLEPIAQTKVIPLGS